MQRKELIRELKKLHHQMQANLIVAKVDVSKFDEMISKSEDFDEASLTIFHDQLIQLMAPGAAYHGFMGIYGLKSPEWWVNMQNLGETNLREHLLLNAAAKVLRLDWKTRRLNGKKAKQDAVTETASGI